MGKAVQNLVIFAKDVERMSSFYQHVFGLAAVEAEESHELLVSDGIELVIHSIPKSIANSITIESPPKIRESTPIKPAFQIENMEVAKSAIEKHGGTLKSIDSAWSLRGYIVLDGTDPEGNVLQFKQKA